MKKFSMFLTVCFVVLSFGAMAQIQINSSGYVGIGTAPSSSYKLQLQQYNITGKGKQTVTINGNSFEPGMYLYALVIDGKEVDTKRMILTK